MLEPNEPNKHNKHLGNHIDFSCFSVPLKIGDRFLLSNDALTCKKLILDFLPRHKIFFSKLNEYLDELYQYTVNESETHDIDKLLTKIINLIKNENNYQSKANIQKELIEARFNNYTLLGKELNHLVKALFIAGKDNTKFISSLKGLYKSICENFPTLSKNTSTSLTQLLSSTTDLFRSGTIPDNADNIVIYIPHIVLENSIAKIIGDSHNFLYNIYKKSFKPSSFEEVIERITSFHKDKNFSPLTQMFDSEIGLFTQPAVSYNNSNLSITFNIPLCLHRNINAKFDNLKKHFEPLKKLLNQFDCKMGIDYNEKENHYELSFNFLLPTNFNLPSLANEIKFNDTRNPIITLTIPRNSNTDLVLSLPFNSLLNPNTSACFKSIYRFLQEDSCFSNLVYTEEAVSFFSNETSLIGKPLNYITLPNHFFETPNIVDFQQLQELLNYCHPEELNLNLRNQELFSESLDTLLKLTKFLYLKNFDITNMNEHDLLSKLTLVYDQNESTQCILYDEHSFPIFVGNYIADKKQFYGRIISKEERNMIHKLWKTSCDSQKYHSKGLSMSYFIKKCSENGIELDDYAWRKIAGTLLSPVPDPSRIHKFFAQIDGLIIKRLRRSGNYIVTQCQDHGRSFYNFAEEI